MVKEVQNLVKETLQKPQVEKKYWEKQKPKKGF